MITPPPIADLFNISIAGASLEHALQRWIDESTRYTTLDVPTLVEAVDFYTRLLAVRKTVIKLSRLCSFECSNSPLVTRHAPLDTPPIDDLAPLHACGFMIECVLVQWTRDIERCPNPDVPTIAEAIDLFTRVASARKILIKLSQLTPPRPSRPNKSDRKTTLSGPPDPVVASDIQLPGIPDLPYDQLRPELDFITSAFDHIGINTENEPQNVEPSPSPAMEKVEPTLSPATPSDSPAPQPPQDAQAPNGSHISHSSHSSHPSHSPHSSQPRKKFG